MLIADLSALTAYLAGVQDRRDSRLSCELTLDLSARMTDAALAEALVSGLPMAQGLERRILRCRGRGARITARLHWRDGVRMLRFCRESSAPPLTPQEQSALALARAAAQKTLLLTTDEARLRHVLSWVCERLRYAHTAPGQKGYAQLVGAAGAITGGLANCQGFADTVYLLCGLCGLEAEYRIGRGERQLHVWNAVRIGSRWVEVDASRMARGLAVYPGRA